MTLPTGITETVPGQGAFSRVLDWLTAGYPNGIPQQDRFAVVAVLKRRLSDDQVKEIVHDLTRRESANKADGIITDAEIATLTHRVLEEQPSPSDLSRVSAKLAAAGWPLEGEQLPGADD